MPKPMIPQLDLPNLPNPSNETALFQHEPSPSAKVKKEWEPGCQPDEVYDAALPAWRAGARRYLVRRLRGENQWMAEWQKGVRTEMRDKFFYWTAIFGTHTFFMAFLPLFFWYGHPLKGRGMLNAVGLGIYISSFSKDLVCTPRPYSPPVIRIAMSTHAHEYGFPSSHSTNSFTIALFLSQWLWEMRDTVGWSAMTIANFVLFTYVVSVVGGRVYTGMHSIDGPAKLKFKADIVGGSLMGIACWAIGLFGGDYLERWTISGSLSVPLLFIPITGACVHYHPQPVDPCPCFEDAIAVLSVMLGEVMGQWLEVRYGLVASALSTHLWERGPVIGIILVIERLVVGIALLFGWRIAAKTVLLRVLPGAFRFTSNLLDFDLPTRKGYTAATAYEGFPTAPIRAVPSFIDLTTTTASSNDASPVDSPVIPTLPNGTSHIPGHLSPLLMPEAASLRKRSVKGSASPLSSQSQIQATTDHLQQDRKHRAGTGRKRRPTEIKFDVEVLTKVIVYFGIGLLACTGMAYIYSWIEDRLFGLLQVR